MNKQLLEFSVNVYGEVEKYNDVLSRARCRIFYKYANRNGTYITDEFAEKLIASLPYAPVKGIYEDTDYTDHGGYGPEARAEGRIYGIVPENPNIQWETHLDEDGKERTYACCDVLLFTALYKEATEIVGKSQSMELYEPSLKYHEAIVKGQRMVVFDEGCFLGLQVLGDEVEPCFEGASFYTLRDSIENIINKIKENSIQYEKGGSTEMTLNFKLSDDDKYSAIWFLLNTYYNEENNWTITYAINSVYDDYALAFNLETGNYERIYYVKNDEQDSVEIDHKEEVYVMDITESEKQTVETLRKLNGDTYELVSDVLINAQENQEKNSSFSSKIEELENTIATLNTEKSEFENVKASQEAKIQELISDNEVLNDYKLNIENQQKEAIIYQYEDKLPSELLDSYREKAGEYSPVDLDKELAYELKNNNIQIFSKDPDSFRLPNDGMKDGITEILDRYKKN